MVSAVVRRHAPEEVSPSTSRGAAAGKRDYRLARLLACGTCGTFLTGSRDARRGDVRYYCHRAKVTPHARGWVNESKVLPAVRDEAHRADLIVKRMQVGKPEDEAAASKLAEKRDRILANFEDGLIDKATRDAKLAAVAEAESKLSVRRWVNRIRIPPIIMDTTDEDGAVVEADDPSKVNAYLRRLFERVTVDMSKPALRGPSSWVPTVHVKWRDLSMRADRFPADGAASLARPSRKVDKPSPARPYFAAATTSSNVLRSSHD